MLWWDEKDWRVGAWRFALPVILVFLSAMMVSEVKYPTFKKINWRTQHPFVKTLIIVVLIGLTVMLWQKILPVAATLLFVGYLIYGFVRPFISRRLQREIEVDDEPDDDDAAPASRPT